MIYMINEGWKLVSCDMINEGWKKGYIDHEKKFLWFTWKVILKVEKSLLFEEIESNNIGGWKSLV